MCRVHCEVAEGLASSEKIVRIPVHGGGIEEVSLDSSLVNQDTVAVALVRRGDNYSLVELPRETATGKWRIWVPNSKIEPSVEAPI